MTTSGIVGQRVCVSAGGPVPWRGRVIAARPGWLTVLLDNGRHEIVDVTRRAIVPCPDAMSPDRTTSVSPGRSAGGRTDASRAAAQ